MIRGIENILVSADPSYHTLKQTATNLLSTILCAYESINQNPLITYFMMSDSLKVLVEVMVNFDQEFGMDVLFITGMLLNYKKYDQANPYATGYTSVRSTQYYEKIYQIVNSKLAISNK